MRPKGIVFLVITLVVCLSALAPTMPLSPYAIRKAGGLARLSDAVLSPPPEWVDRPLGVPAGGHSGNYQILIIVIEFTDQAHSYSCLLYTSPSPRD